MWESHGHPFYSLPPHLVNYLLFEPNYHIEFNSMQRGASGDSPMIKLISSQNSFAPMNREGKTSCQLFRILGFQKFSNFLDNRNRAGNKDGKEKDKSVKVYKAKRKKMVFFFFFEFYRWLKLSLKDGENAKGKTITRKDKEKKKRD